MITVALPLLGNGLPESAVFATLRDKFPDRDKTDREIHDVISWCSQRNPTPSGYGKRNGGERYLPPQVRQPLEVKPKPPKEHAEWWLDGLTLTPDEFAQKSQLEIPKDRKASLVLMLEMLYEGTDCINVVWKHILREGKASPLGGGTTNTRDEWLQILAEKNVPQSDAGAWVRPNPCKPQGSGKGGSVMDSDIVAHRFLLLESDILPINLQLALFSKLKLPIALVVASGGLSAHAWIKVESKTAEQYSATAARILEPLKAFGIDQGNKNPSRLSRLTGAVRTIGGVDGGLQRLLWLNPAKPCFGTDELDGFIASLEFPAVDEKPFRKIVLDSITRYQNLYENKVSIGVPTGLADFDRASGGLFPGQMSVLSGETNSGKSTIVLNIINSALLAGHGVALFTLEMGRDEITDFLFSLNCRVDRNHFNTGKFTVEEIQSMIERSRDIATFPLWVFDDSTITAAQIRKRVLALKAEGRIGLAVVDYVQITMPDNLFNNREQEVAAVARALCATAKDGKLPVLVLSQLNDDRKLRESRVIGHEAHNVFLIENEKDEKMALNVIKGRRIPKGRYELFYEPIFCKVASAAKVNDADLPKNKKPYKD